MITKINTSFSGLRIKDDGTQKRIDAFFDNKYKRKAFDISCAAMNMTARDHDVFLSFSPEKKGILSQEVVISDNKNKELVRIFLDKKSNVLELVQDLRILNTLLKTYLEDLW